MLSSILIVLCAISDETTLRVVLSLAPRKYDIDLTRESRSMGTSRPGSPRGVQDLQRQELTPGLPSFLWGKRGGLPPP